MVFWYVDTMKFGRWVPKFRSKCSPHIKVDDLSAYPEHRSSKFLRKAGTHLQHYTVSHSSRPWPLTHRHKLNPVHTVISCSFRWRSKHLYYLVSQLISFFLKSRDSNDCCLLRTEDKPSSSYGKPPCDRVTHIPQRSITIYSLVRNRKQTRPGYSRRHGTKYLAWNPFSLTRAATLPLYSILVLVLPHTLPYVLRPFCS